MGEEQALQAPPSRRHSKVDPGSLELKPKLADVLVVEPDGPLPMLVSGAVESTVNVLASDCPRLPAASDCSARAVYVPSPYRRPAAGA